jgi:hypothetical protein
LPLLSFFSTQGAWKRGSNFPGAIRRQSISLTSWFPPAIPGPDRPFPARPWPVSPIRLSYSPKPRTQSLISSVPSVSFCSKSTFFRVFRVFRGFKSPFLCSLRSLRLTNSPFPHFPSPLRASVPLKKLPLKVVRLQPVVKSANGSFFLHQPPPGVPALWLK